MDEQPPYPEPKGDTGEDAGVQPNQESTTGTPRWVKVFGITAIVLVLLFVIVQIISGGSHGPGRHMPSGDTMPSNVTEHLLQQA